MRVEDLYDAAARSGLLTKVVVDGHPVHTEFRSPDNTVLDGLAVSADYAIRYPASWLPDLAPGQTIYIEGVAYRVRDKQAIGDGTERRATLSRL
ncbi:head-tail joining protein [Eleftheria terrae]|uniref:head-tail joining protein n=1 Tax=Eleftheria terrae TaxID=1597781 RepID=UPI00263BB9AB|nr:hypothetical protein [Eleftheria terrae]WKB54376.1 hypothetical protein N7L95_08315 [Eleftheria terrae]